MGVQPPPTTSQYHRICPADLDSSPTDWANLDLTKHLPVNGHVEARFYKSTQKWTTPTLVTDPNISVSGICPGLNYGQQCYEGLKAVRQESGAISVFRPRFRTSRHITSDWVQA